MEIIARTILKATYICFQRQQDVKDLKKTEALRPIISSQLLTQTTINYSILESTY